MPPFANSPLKRSESMKQPQTPSGKQKLNRHEIARLASIHDDGTPPSDTEGLANGDGVANPAQDAEQIRGRRRAVSGPQGMLRSSSTSITPLEVPKGKTEAARTGDAESKPSMELARVPSATHDGQTRPAPALTNLNALPTSLGSPDPSLVRRSSTIATDVPRLNTTQLDGPSDEDGRDEAETITSNPATGAYRDLTTGAVVETDNDGNQAEPTTHPNIRSIDGNPGSTATSPTIGGPSDVEMPGLEAAAEFLSHDRKLTRVATVDGTEHAPAHERGQFLPGGPHDEDGAGDGWQDNPQVTGFAVASSKRNADFHALFPSVPEDDFLIENYGCAISRDLLIQGRMYVSEAHVCFYSSIFGWVTSIVVPFSDIISIEKRNTAYLIPNAIQLKTLQNKYLFSSLVTRDLTYSMLVNIWRLSQPSAATQEQAVATDAASEAQSDEEHEKSKDSLCSTKALSKRERLRKRLAVARHQAKKSDNSSVDGHDGASGTAASASIDANEDTDVESSSEDEGEEATGKVHEPTQCNCDKEKLHLSNIVLDEAFPATVRQIFDLLFTTDFIATFLTDNQHLHELQIGEWEDENLSSKEVTAARKVSYVKPLNGPIGPKQTRCDIVEEQLHIDFDDYCTTMTTTRTPDVPNGSSFAVKTRTCFTWAENNQTKLYVTCAVEWTGRSMIRGIIDKASIEGQKQYYQDLSTALRKHIEEHPDQYAHTQAKPSQSSTPRLSVASATSTAKQVPVSPTSSSPRSPYVAEEKPSEPASLWDTVYDTTMSFSEALNTRPTVLLLGALIVLLLLSHVVLFFRGSPGVSRDPSYPHHLLSPLAAKQQQPFTLRHASVMIEDEVQQALDALAHSRRLTEALEQEIQVLRETIQAQTRQHRDKIDGSTP